MIGENESLASRRGDVRVASVASDARLANSVASGAIRSFDDILAAQDARRASKPEALASRGGDVRVASVASDARGANSAASQNLANPQVSRDSRAPQVAPTASTPTAALHKTRIIGHYGGFRKTISFAYVCLVYHATTLFCERLYSYKNDPLGKTSGQMVGAARSASAWFNSDASKWLRLTSPLSSNYSATLILMDVARKCCEPTGACGRVGSRISLKVGEKREASEGVSRSLLPPSEFIKTKSGRMRKMVARKGRNAGKPFWSCRDYPNCKGTRPWGGSRWAD